MAAIAVSDPGTTTAGYPDVFCRADGDVTSSFFDPPDTLLWSLVATLGDGATLSWSEEHGDEAVRVLEGALDTTEGRCDAGDAAIIEAGVATTMRAVGRARVLHVGSNVAEPPVDGPLGPAAPGGHRVHRFPGSEVRTVLKDEENGSMITARMFADSSCPTCRLHLTEVACDGPLAPLSHMHSHDELIYVLDGTLRSGRTEVPAGSTVFIPGGMRYSLRSKEAVALVNFRRDASMITFAAGSTPRLETSGAADS